MNSIIKYTTCVGRWFRQSTIRNKYITINKGSIMLLNIPGSQNQFMETLTQN